MWFALQQVTSIARDVAREHQPGVHVVAVTPSEGGVEVAELIVAAHDETAGVVSIPIVRAGTDAELRSSIAAGLSRHFGRTKLSRLDG